MLFLCRCQSQNSANQLFFNQLQQDVHTRHRHPADRLSDAGNRVVAHVQNPQAVVTDELHLLRNAHAQLPQFFQNDNRMDIGAGKNPVVFTYAVSDALLQKGVDPADALLTQRRFFPEVPGGSGKPRFRAGFQKGLSPLQRLVFQAGAVS